MIKICGVQKHFQNEKAIIYSDMVFDDGKSYMLLGAFGCGKSTLLNMIAGILSTDAGEIYIGDGRTQYRLYIADELDAEMTTVYDDFSKWLANWEL